MLVWIAIIYLLLVGFGSFMEWSAKSKFGGFVFLSVLGSMVGGLLWGVAATLSAVLFDIRWYSDLDSMDSYVEVLLGLGMVSGMAWALIQVNSKDSRRLYRKLENQPRCGRCGKVQGKTCWLDYCAQCETRLCEDCMAAGCCGHTPARSGEDEETKDLLRTADEMISGVWAQKMRAKRHRENMAWLSAGVLFVLLGVMTHGCS